MSADYEAESDAIRVRRLKAQEALVARGDLALLSPTFLRASFALRVVHVELARGLGVGCRLFRIGFELSTPAALLVAAVPRLGLRHEEACELIAEALDLGLWAMSKGEPWSMTAAVGPVDVLEVYRFPVCELDRAVS